MAYSIMQLPRLSRDDTGILSAYIQKIKEHRLNALENDPQSFSSSYEYEVQQGTEFWEERNLRPDLRHLVAVNFQHDKNTGDVLNVPWLGSLVLLGPRAVQSNFDSKSTWKSFLDGTPLPKDFSVQHGDGVTVMYLIVAVYVDTSFRRQGLGECLIRQALDTIHKETLGGRRAICIITVFENNLVAQRIYSRTGFEKVAEDIVRTRAGEERKDFILRKDIFGNELME